MKHVDLEKFANGAFSAQVNRAIEEVTENIQNPNTDAGHLHRHSELLLLSVWARTCRPAR